MDLLVSRDMIFQAVTVLSPHSVVVRVVRLGFFDTHLSEREHCKREPYVAWRADFIVALQASLHV